jgi:hypothetical protein
VSRDTVRYRMQRYGIAWPRPEPPFPSTFTLRARPQNYRRWVKHRRDMRLQNQWPPSLHLALDATGDNQFRDCGGTGR